MDNTVIVGDPHLGKRFVHGVPLHRRGEREARMLDNYASTFESLENVELHVTLGDLFEGVNVDNDLFFSVLSLLDVAAEFNPQTTFVIMKGNHDAVRDSDKKSAFDLLKASMRFVDNVVFVDSVAEFMFQDGRAVGFVAYNMHGPVTDFVERLSDGLDRVFMHADVDFGHDNLIPTGMLAAKGIFKVINGHDHKARIIERDGVKIFVHGSMEPLAHDQDTTGALYVTATLADVEADPKAYEDKCLKLRLKAGEDVPDIDCLKLDIEREKVRQEEIEVDFDTFSPAEIVGRKLAQAEVSKPLIERVLKCL